MTRTNWRQGVPLLLVLACATLVGRWFVSRSPISMELGDRIDRASAVELLSLDPTSLTERNRRQEIAAEIDHLPLPPAIRIPPGDDFHDYPVLGRAILHGVDKRELCNALVASIDRSDGAFALCFQPRHGVRFESDGGRYDLLICFHCKQLYLYRPMDVRSSRILIDRGADAFNAILTRFGAPLPKD